MYGKDAADLYDVIFASKDYEQESTTILQVFGPNGGGNLIDIGCGTLGHTRHLAQFFKEVLALDTSEDMIKKARQTAAESNLLNIKCHLGSIETVDLSGKFDLAISMFNVVNHILDLRSLESLVKSVLNSLSPGGVWIFDCWNGNSARVDVPYLKTSKEFFHREKKLKLVTSTESNFREGLVSMRTKFPNWEREIDSVPPAFPKLQHRLWTPDILEELLLLYGFSDIKIFDFNNVPEIPDFLKSRRLLFRAERA